MKAVQLLLLVIGIVRLAGLATAGGGAVEQNKALLEWIRDLGGEVDGVSLQSIPGMGMGLVSTRDLEVWYTKLLSPYFPYIKTGEVVTRTPLTAFISLEHALVSEPFTSLSELLPNLSNINLKALFLAYERNKSRRWRESETGEEDKENEGVEKVVEEKDKENEGVEEVVEEEVKVEEKGEEVECEGGQEEGKCKKEEEEEEAGREKDRSYWEPYLNSLPSELHTTLFFTEDDLEHLQTSMVTRHQSLCLPLN